MRYVHLMTVSLSCVVALAACGPSADEVRELRDGQRQIMAKLAELDKKLDQGTAHPAAAPAANIDPNKVYSLPVGSSPVLGPENAPVTIVEFADFQCPFCAKVPGVVDEVLKGHPKDVKFVYKQLPLVAIHPNAMNASRAALAAHKQGKYWEMYAKLFANQRALDLDSLKKTAHEIGLDMTQFEKDMASPEIQKQIDDEVNLAKAAQVNGTPTLFVNGKRVTDRSVGGLTKMIDDALRAKS